jgi:hypothetical protein
MNSETKNIFVHPDKGIRMVAFVPFTAVALGVEMWRRDINLFWWAPPLALVTGLVISLPFRRPREIVFNAANRTMELRYGFGRPPRIYRFNELSSIHSYITTSPESDTNIRLEVRLKKGGRIAIKEQRSYWTDSFRYQEPKELAGLRTQIASLTGVKDHGFRSSAT